MEKEKGILFINQAQSGHGFHRYTLVANPNTAAAKNITAEARLFFERYENEDAVSFKPRITIATFTARDAMEDTLIRYIQRICSGQPGFTVELNNFGSLPPNSIHLRVQNPEAVMKFAAQLTVVNDYITTCGCPRLQVNHQPLINLTNSLTHNLYLQALLETGQQSFHQIFTVAELQLIRSSPGIDIEKVVTNFYLKPTTHILYN